VVITGSDARVGVHGMGGIGKSVLAVAIARDREIRRSYPDGIIWLTIGQQPNLVTLQRHVARHLGSKEHFDTEPQGRGVLRQLLAQKAVLLVLDDVWQTCDAQAFDVLGPRGRALVTTRDAGILHTLGGPSVPVSLLTEEQALQLLADAVGVEPSALPPQALEVVKECGYLPLGVALCGGMVKKHGGDWTVVLERLRRADIEKIADRQAIDERHRSIWRTMQVSVDTLSSEEQRRFAELAVFARANPVPEAAVATLWSYTGDLSDLDTTDLLVNLADRSLIRLSQATVKPGDPINRHISLHDLLYDFATKLAGDLKAAHMTLLAAYRRCCPDGWHDGPDDGYFYQHLAYHLRESGRSGDLKKLLFEYRWLRKKLKVTDANGLMADYDLAGADSQARLIQDAIRLSSHRLAQDRSRLPSQLVGRLLSQKGAGVKALLSELRTAEKAVWLRPLVGILAPPGGPLLRTLTAHEDFVNAVALTPDGEYVISGSHDKTLKVWELASGRPVRTLSGHEGEVLAVAVTPDGRYVVSGLRNGTLKVWDLASGRVVHTMADYKEGGHTPSRYTAAGYGPSRCVEGVRGVAMTPNGRYAISGLSNGTLKVWDLARGRVVQVLADPEEDGDTLSHHYGEVHAVAVTPDGRHAISGLPNRTLKVWNIESGQAVHTLLGHESAVLAVAVTPDGRHVVSGSANGILMVWELASGRKVHTLEGHRHRVTAVAVTPDGQHAVSGSYDKTLMIWDLARGGVVRISEGHESAVLAVAVTPDGRYVVSGSADGILMIWELASGRVVRTLAGCEEGVYAVAVTPDGRYVVATMGVFDEMLNVWELASGRAVHSLYSDDSRLNTVTVTPDGRYAVSGSCGGTLKVWELASGRVIRTLASHVNGVLALAVTRDGRYVVSASLDKTLKVWELASGRTVHTLVGHAGEVYAVAVTSDGQYVVSGSNDQTLRV
jgi:WD40 repeat protein